MGLTATDYSPASKNINAGLDACQVPVLARYKIKTNRIFVFKHHASASLR
jgi:hypothetical protein